MQYRIVTAPLGLAISSYQPCMGTNLSFCRILVIHAVSHHRGIGSPFRATSIRNLVSKGVTTRERYSQYQKKCWKQVLSYKTPLIKWIVGIYFRRCSEWKLIVRGVPLTRALALNLFLRGCLSTVRLDSTLFVRVDKTVGAF